MARAVRIRFISVLPFFLVDDAGEFVQRSARRGKLGGCGPMSLTIYGDSISGNCLKVKWVAQRLRLKFDWIETSVITGETRTPQFLALNAAGQVPLVILEDGRPLAQSNAIMLHLAESSDLVPRDAYDRAKMLEWLFWEQYSHEPYVAVARFQMVYLGKKLHEREARIVEKAESALDVLEQALSGRTYLVGDELTLADISLLAYTRLAPEGGFILSHRPAVRKWIAQCERDLNISSDQPAATGGARHG